MVQIWGGLESLMEAVGLNGGAKLAILKMEAALISETSVEFCQTAQLHIPENIVFKSLMSFTSISNFIISSGTADVTVQSYIFFTTCEISVKVARILQIRLKNGIMFRNCFFFSFFFFSVVVSNTIFDNVNIVSGEPYKTCKSCFYQQIRMRIMSG